MTTSNNDDNSSNNSNVKPIQIKCPQCGRLTVYSIENPSRPFCSDRCKLIDLGQWADQSYKIPSNTESVENSDELEDAEDFETKD